MTRSSVSTFLLFLSLFTLSGCGIDVIDQQFRTNFEVPKPSGPTEPVQVSKTFSFSSQPEDIDSVRLTSASLLIDSPANADLAFLSNIKIYFEHNGERILIASGTNFMEGQGNASLTIEHTGDLKPYVDGNSFKVIWIVTPDRFYSDWPDDGFGLITDLAFEVDVNL